MTVIVSYKMLCIPIKWGQCCIIHFTIRSNSFDEPLLIVILERQQILYVVSKVVMCTIFCMSLQKIVHRYLCSIGVVFFIATTIDIALDKLVLSEWVKVGNSGF